MVAADGRQRAGGAIRAYDRRDSRSSDHTHDARGVQLHLFSTGNQEDDPGPALEACRRCLRGKQDASIAYLPLGSLFAEKWLSRIEKAFSDMARIEPINTETMELSEMEGILRRAAVAYIPGGNAFLLNHRLNVSQLMPSLRKKVLNGLPLVAVDAGAVVCGPNILTANDLNVLPTPHFKSLDLTPFQCACRLHGRRPQGCLAGGVPRLPRQSRAYVGGWRLRGDRGQAHDSEHWQSLVLARREREGATYRRRGNLSILR